MSYWNRTGDAWKYRNGEPRTSKRLNTRKAGFEPQWTLEQIWQNPFKEERRYATDGLRVWTEWKPIPSASKTGVRIFDEWLQYISEGNYDTSAFCKRYPGLLNRDLDSLAIVLTGMNGCEFLRKYRLRTVDLLLRHTDLSPDEVARRSGFGSKNNLYLACKREFGIAPVERRKAIQKEGDIGRYR